MTDFTAFAITNFLGGSEQCATHAGEFVEDWMAWRGLEEEPFIHTGATVGGGAVHNAGKEPKPMSYLGDEDFMFLDGLLAAEPDCAV